jgi:hypothetical protein
MRFNQIESGIEAYGMSVDAFVDAFKLFPSIALKKLVSHGVGTVNAKGEIVIERDSWYPLGNMLAAVEGIATNVGPRALFQMGQHVPKHAPFPPTITDIRSGLASLDAAYHMNHRKNGKPMFDQATGRKMSGIGHYVTTDTGPRKITVVCDNPYPCDFDRGIIAGVAQRFERAAKVTHDDHATCRKSGADSCTYHITW